MRFRIIIAVIVILVIGLAFFCYNPFGLDYMNSNEHIVFCSKNWRYTMAVVSDRGNVYLNSGRLEESQNFGIEDTHKFNCHNPKKYVEIYSKENAQVVSLTNYGGTIITNQKDVYIFQNGNSQYRTPTYILTGYSQAMLWDNDTLYLLSDSGDFGYIHIDKPDDFRIIKSNVKKFVIAEKGKETMAFVLSNNERLYFLKQAELMDNNENYIDGIVDFDILVPHSQLLIFSCLNTHSEASFLMGDYDLSFDDLNNSHYHFTKTGDNMVSVVSYGRGIAMLDNSHRVYLYGNDLDGSGDGWSFSPDLEFKGDQIAENVDSVFGGYLNLDIIKQDGEFIYYGLTADQTYNAIN